MNSMLSVNDLKAFEQKVVDIFNKGEIRAPIHLSGGNEHRLISIFRWIRPQDWVLTTWRSHYHCLLKNVPEDQLLADIRAGRSITLCYPEHRILSSAIVGGVLPIAVGLAWSIKRQRSDDKVWVFIGDMTASTGMFSECARYADGHKLPIHFVVEDNGKSVLTDTDKVWGGKQKQDVVSSDVGIRYRYDLTYPHQGTGRRVEF